MTVEYIGPKTPPGETDPDELMTCCSCETLEPDTLAEGPDGDGVYKRFWKGMDGRWRCRVCVVRAGLVKDLAKNRQVPLTSMRRARWLMLKELEEKHLGF